MLTDDDVISTEMEVVCADGAHIGRVAAVLSCDLQLSDERAHAHLVPLAFIHTVDDVVRLVVTESEARRAWRRAF